MRDIDVIPRILSLLALVTLVYWRDLSALAYAAHSLSWIGFTITAVLLASTFLYQRREALAAFAKLSERKDALATILIAVAIILYTFGSYHEAGLWLHLISLVIFVEALLTLRIDYRIAKLAFFPLIGLVVVSLWLVPSFSITEALSSNTIIHFLSAIYAVALAISIVIGGLKARSAKASLKRPCPICQINQTKALFCHFCGRLQKTASPIQQHESGRQTLPGFLIPIAIVIILTSTSLPILVLADDRPNITLFMANGPHIQPMIATPQDWVLESSTRLTSYEIEHSENYALLSSYAEKRYAENKLYILLEISNNDLIPNKMQSWHIEGWTRNRNTVNIGNNMWDLITLKRQNHTIIALYNPHAHPISLFFRSDSSFEVKNIGLSIFMNLTDFAENEMSEVTEKLKKVAEPITSRWEQSQLWTLRASTFLGLYAQIERFFYTVAAVVFIFSFASWGKTKDDKEAQTLDKILSLEEDEALILATAIRAKRGQTGEEILNVYKDLQHVDLEGFCESLGHLAKLKLIKKHYEQRNGQVLLTWKPTIN
ncbi:MAG: hypothetical protein JSW72_01380 [Candidatus Bathyarchaeota archaeon]|nr:MAG: hypothetical protein JSW72_01380 [Candidatus Bathyarchaeota archaeon]